MLFAAPLIVCTIGVVLWAVYGFGPLNRAEFPLARAINATTGHSHLFDHIVIFFNRWRGEALTVIFVFTAFALFARWVVGPLVDWRRVAAFSGYVFAVWFVTNAISVTVVEPSFPRESPSLMAGAAFMDLADLHDTKVKISSPKSFPSNHGNVFFIVFFMALFRWGRRAWVLFPLCLLLSMPRCFTGAHWVTDTLIGSVLLTWVTALLAVRTPLFRCSLFAEEMARRALAFAEKPEERALRDAGARSI